MNTLLTLRTRAGSAAALPLVLALAACTSSTTDEKPVRPGDGGAAARGDAGATTTDGGGPAPGDDGGGEPPAYGHPTEGHAPVTKLSGGYKFVEGPLWRASTGKLLFSDVNANRIHELTPPNAVSVFREASNAANGLALDPEGRLVVCEGSQHRVTVTEADGTIRALTGKFEGKSLNGPNDAIVRSDGTLYFTDPKWAAGADRQPFQGVFRRAPDGTLATIARDMTNPNGIALSPDEKTLYVDDDQDFYVRAYPVDADGSVGTGVKFTDTAETPDGMAIDRAGNLYVATIKGVEVYTKTAEKLDTLAVPEAPANVSFGGPSGKTLYITARTGIYSVDLNVPGLP